MATTGPERGPTGPEPREPGHEPGAGAGSRLREAGKAIGCVALALLVLAIAIVIGVFDIFF